MFEPSGKNEVGQDVSVFDAPSLSAEEMTEHYAGIIANALTNTGMVEIREIQANLVNQVHILARVQEKNARVVAQRLVKTILLRTENTDVEAFCGKQFLIKKGQLVYAWVFSFGSQNLQGMAQTVCDAIDDAVPRKKVEVLEAPLMGPGTPQSSGPGSKGAAPVRG